MWFAALLTLLDAVLPHWTWVLPNRVIIAGAPLTIFDFMLGAGLIFVIVCAGRTMSAFPTEGHHPALKWILGSFVLFFLASALAATMYANNPRYMVPRMRDFLALPITVLMGYFLTATPRHAARWANVQYLAGILTALLLMFTFGDRASHEASGGKLVNIRVMEYMPSFAGIAAAAMFFSISAGLNRFPKLLVAVTAGVCFVGQCATLSRSDWLAAIAALFWTVRLIPRGARGRGAINLGIAVVITGTVVCLGISAASMVSGRDAWTMVTKRLETLLPRGSEDSSNDLKAWDSRLPGIFGELRIFSSSPVIGAGFGGQETNRGAVGEIYAEETAYHHNDWTTVLAEGGVIGLAYRCILIFSTIIVGRRMVAARWDRTSMIIGALGSIAGFYWAVLGVMTGGMNSARGGIVFGMLCGVMLRTRQMQLTSQKWSGYLPDLMEHELGDAGVESVANGEGRHHVLARA